VRGIGWIGSSVFDASALDDAKAVVSVADSMRSDARFRCLPLAWAMVNRMRASI
jgi:hypothetical protein